MSPDTTTLYLAGPMTGHPAYNFDAFDRARNHLRGLGYAVVCPAELDREAGFDPEVDTWTADHQLAAGRRDLRAIANVDAVAVLHGFTASRGARVELTAARWLGLPIVAADNPHLDLTAAVDRWLTAEADTAEVDQLDGDASGERRVVDPDTGGEKGTKLARFDLIPAAALWQVAEHYGRGAAKYSDRNWELGYAWSLSYGALCRHLYAWWGGEDIDPETGSHHLAAVTFHALALLTFTDTHPSKDDRPQ